MALVGAQTYVVSWTEATTGMTVSHVMNLGTLHVDAFWTWADDKGARSGELHGGKLTLISG